MWLRLAEGQALRSPVTTHMLDTALGQPAQNVPVQLLRRYDTIAQEHASRSCRSWRSWWYPEWYPEWYPGDAAVVYDEGCKCSAVQL